jgi:hypothetical protein
MERYNYEREKNFFTAFLASLIAAHIIVADALVIVWIIWSVGQA